MSTLLADPRLAQCRRLYLRDWAVDANIGVYSAERAGTQQIVLNVDVFVTLASTTPRHDELSEVFDYDTVRAVVQERIARGHVNLQETLVDEIVTALLGRSGRRGRARVQREDRDLCQPVAGIGVEVLRFRELP